MEAASPRHCESSWSGVSENRVYLKIPQIGSPEMQITKSSVGCRDVIACSSSTCNTTAICHCLSPGSETWPCKHINFNYIRVIYFDIHTEVSGIRAFTDTASYNQQMPVLEMAVDREAAG